jgi:hypothetical protein
VSDPTAVKLEYQVIYPIFSDTPGKNDLDNDPLQGRSLLKQANLREKPNAI